MTTNGNPLAQLRLALADARMVLRETKDTYTLVKAASEQQANVDGKNADERARKLLLALEADSAYVRALSALRTAEYHMERLEAQIECALDDRRAWEWSIRSALVDALGAAGKDDEAAFDAADMASLDCCLTYRPPPQPDDTAEWFGR